MKQAHSQAKVALVGIPSDINSSFLRGCAEAPKAIRKVLYDGSANLFSEDGTNLENNPYFKDIGDIAFQDGPEMLEAVEKNIRRMISDGIKPLSLGGDHAITYPIIKAFSSFFKDLTILHFDAHPDLYDIFNGNRLSHACPFARIMENGLAHKLIQVGIRTQTDHQRAQAKRFNVRTVTMRDFPKTGKLKIEGPVYISLDLDALDPAYAPGVSHQEPGGLSVRDILNTIMEIESPIVGADIVELNPHRDKSEVTSRVAAKLLKELAAMMLV